MDITWTSEDEEALTRLQEKKDAFNQANERAVYKLAEDMYFYNMSSDELTTEFIRHADELCRVLKPYLKEKS